MSNIIIKDLVLSNEINYSPISKLYKIAGKFNFSANNKDIREIWETVKILTALEKDFFNEQIIKCDEITKDQKKYLKTLSKRWYVLGFNIDYYKHSKFFEVCLYDTTIKLIDRMLQDYQSKLYEFHGQQVLKFSQVKKRNYELEYYKRTN